TTVGSTNGTVASARATARPRNVLRYNRNAPGTPRMTLIAADAAACHTVNQAMRRNRPRPATLANASRSSPCGPVRPRARIDPTGYRKKTNSAAAGRAPRATRPTRRATTAARSDRSAAGPGGVPPGRGEPGAPPAGAVTGPRTAAAPDEPVGIAPPASPVRSYGSISRARYR